MTDIPGSVISVIAAGTRALQAADVADPRREALQLWAGLSPNLEPPLLTPDQLATPEAAQCFRTAVGRRAAGEPLAYVIGNIGFRHLTVRCDQRALIPRPETEGLVEVALARVAGGVAVDAGTGTGAIALSLRHEGRFSGVFGVDVSASALALARENAAASQLDVTWVNGNLLEPFRDGSADLIVANPPYLTQHEHDTLDRSVRDYEPALALLSGDDGLHHTRRLIDRGRVVVRPGGTIALELDSRRAEESARIAADTGWQDITIIDDLFGRARYLVARRGMTDD